MIKNRKELIKSVINEVKSLLKYKQKITVVSAEIKQGASYNESCLIFLNDSEEFLFHYFSMEKKNGEYDVSNADFGLLHSLKLLDVMDVIEDEKLKNKAQKFYIKFQKEKYEKKFPSKNINDKKIKI